MRSWASSGETRLTAMCTSASSLAEGGRIHPPQQARDRFLERRRRRQEAQHEIGLALEIEEVPGMHQDAVLLGQGEDPVFLRTRGRHVEDRGPSALHVE